MNRTMTCNSPFALEASFALNSKCFPSLNDNLPMPLVSSSTTRLGTKDDYYLDGEIMSLDEKITRNLQVSPIAGWRSWTGKGTFCFFIDRFSKEGYNREKFLKMLFQAILFIWSKLEDYEIGSRQGRGSTGKVIWGIAKNHIMLTMTWFLVVTSSTPVAPRTGRDTAMARTFGSEGV